MLDRDEQDESCTLGRRGGRHPGLPPSGMEYPFGTIPDHPPLTGKRPSNPGDKKVGSGLDCYKLAVLSDQYDRDVHECSSVSSTTPPHSAWIGLRSVSFLPVDGFSKNLRFVRDPGGVEAGDGLRGGFAGRDVLRGRRLRATLQFRAPQRRRHRCRRSPRTHASRGWGEREGGDRLGERRPPPTGKGGP